MSRDVEISAVVATYNRSDALQRAIQGLLAQEGCSAGHEVIIVDNNSTDRTRSVVESFVHRADVPLRYIFEQKQGVSHARNAGIAAARGAIIAFLDDDVTPAPSWLLTLHRAFCTSPTAGFVGGKVLPEWEAPPPAWITRDHWMPLALVDYGDTPSAVNATNRLGLISANLAVRRSALERAGLFAPELQRVKDRIGSMEDHEFLERLVGQGIEGLYVPDLITTTRVPVRRMEREYHRRWHAGHGHFYAIMRSDELEPPSGRRLFGVPAYLYKQAAGDVAGLFRSWWSATPEQAAKFEMRLCFFGGFVRKRYADILSERTARRNQLHWPNSHGRLQ